VTLCYLGCQNQHANKDTHAKETDDALDTSGFLFFRKREYSGYHHHGNKGGVKEGSDQRGQVHQGSSGDMDDLATRFSDYSGRDIIEEHEEREPSIDQPQDQVFLVIAFGYLKDVCSNQKSGKDQPHSQA
jgi:hypothetical protein